MPDATYFQINVLEKYHFMFTALHTTTLNKLWNFFPLVAILLLIADYHIEDSATFQGELILQEFHVNLFLLHFSAVVFSQLYSDQS